MRGGGEKIERGGQGRDEMMTFLGSAGWLRLV